METFTKIIGLVVMVAGAIFAIALVMAIPTMLLWDWLMPEIFGLKEITLLQAFGLNLLCGILFKSSTSSSN